MSVIKSKSRVPSMKAKAPPPKPTIALKSAEFIEDSDESDEAPIQPSLKKAVSFKGKPAVIDASRPTAQAKAAAVAEKTLPDRAKVSPSSSEDGTEDSEEEESAKEKSDSEEDDSEDEDVPSFEIESPSPTKAKTPSAPLSKPNSLPKASHKVQPVNGTKRKAVEGPASNSSSQGESESENDEEGSTEDENESESGSDEEASARVTKEKAAPQIAQPRRSVKPYEPPIGFQTARISLAPSSEAANLLSPLNLEGKQIWHITAPAQLPVASIKQVSAQSLQNGTSIFTHKGADYGLIPQTGQTDEVLILPLVQENQYQSSNTPVASTLHIRQLVQLPNHVTRLAPSTEVINDTDVPRNLQPVDLKMRFRPFGVASSSDSEVETTAQAKQPVSVPQIRPPPTVEQPSPSKKRKHASQSTEPSAVKPKKSRPTPEASTINEASNMDIESPSAKHQTPGKFSKNKHDKRQKAAPENLAIGTEPDPMDIDEPVKQKSNPKPSKHKHDRLNGTTSTAEIPNDKETPEQKAKRKEERRRQRTQGLATKAVAETPTPKFGSNPSSAKSKPEVPLLPLAEFSARLSAQEEAARQERDSSQLPTPGQSSPSKESKLERARRKEEKRKRRAALAAAKEGG